MTAFLKTSLLIFQKSVYFIRKVLKIAMKKFHCCFVILVIMPISSSDKPFCVRTNEEMIVPNFSGVKRVVE